MVERFHGVDRRRRESTVSVLNREGIEKKFVSLIYEFNGYVQTLGPEDVVVMETGAFYWADQIEARGAQCFIVDPYRFRIIKDSWNKTDKRDSRNMSEALWVYMVTGEFGLPLVYKPSALIRELRKLYAQYQLLNKKIRVYKNNILSVLADNGIVLPRVDKNHLLSEKYGKQMLEELDVSEASCICIEMDLALTYFRDYYDEMKMRRGAGRPRIVLIWKLCGIMRRMLLDDKAFKYAEVTLYPRKQIQYGRTLNKIMEEMESKSA